MPARRTAAVALYVLAMAAVDLVFFSQQFWERLAVNVGIVLVFGTFYFRLLHRS